MVASRKKYKNSKNTQRSKAKAKTNKQYAMIGYFHNILLAVALEKCSKLYSSLFANKATT